MISFTKRTCTLGVNLGTPSQKNGEERVPAKVIKVKAAMFDEDELNEFFDDKHAWDMLYVKRASKPALPFWSGKIESFNVPGKYKDCEISIDFGVNNMSVVFKNASVKSMRLEPTEGGLTALTFTIYCLKSHIKGKLAELDEFLGKTCEITIQLGDATEEDDEDQEELGLDHSKSAAAASNGKADEKTGLGKGKGKGKATPAGATVN